MTVDPSPSPTPTSVASGSRPPWWLVVALLVVALGCGFGAGALTFWAVGSDGKSSEHSPSPNASGLPALSPEQYDLCIRRIVLDFDTGDVDTAMREAVARLRPDPRFESVRGRTRGESFVKFKELFADRPELLAIVRPEALPASVVMMVRRGSTAQQVEGALREEFPDSEVSRTRWCSHPPA